MLRKVLVILFVIFGLSCCIYAKEPNRAQNKDSSVSKKKRVPVVKYADAGVTFGQPSDSGIKDSEYRDLISQAKTAYTKYVAAHKNVKFVDGVMDENARKKIDAAFAVYDKAYAAAQKREKYIIANPPVLQSPTANTANQKVVVSEENKAAPFADFAWLESSGTHYEAEEWLKALGPGWRFAYSEDIEKLYNSPKWPIPKTKEFLVLHIWYKVCLDENKASVSHIQFKDRNFGEFRSKMTEHDRGAKIGMFLETPDDIVGFFAIKEQ